MVMESVRQVLREQPQIRDICSISLLIAGLGWCRMRMCVGVYPCLKVPEGAWVPGHMSGLRALRACQTVPHAAQPLSHAGSMPVTSAHLFTSSSLFTQESTGTASRSYGLVSVV
jgi:hypothetical protein